LKTCIGDLLKTFIVAWTISLPALGAPSKDHAIRAFDFIRYFNHQYPECLDNSGSRNAVNDLSVAYFDFAQDGSEEAMVVGSTCRTGTAGPDIHSVYRLISTGQLKELKIKESQTFMGHSIYGDLIGNRNYTFEVQNGHLCEAFVDGSGRESPLTICYKLLGDEFVIDHLDRGPVYRTSFDCSTAQAEWAKVVCGTKELAAADVTVHSLYQQLIRLHPGQEAALEAAQRDWQRKIAEITASKGYGDVLRNAYAARISKLKSELE
jgi:hypothetical protein